MSSKTCGKQYIENTTDHLEVDGITIKVMLEKLSGNMENMKQKCLQSRFLQSDHQGFLKDVEVWFIEKIQASDQTKREFYCIRTLYPDVLNIRSDY